MENVVEIPIYIVNGDILPFVLKDIEGVKVDRPHAENMSILARYVGLREVCKEWKDVVEDMVEYNALRLAIWDAGQVGVTVYTPDSTSFFFREMYMSNLDMFNKSRRLVFPVDDIQLTMPMKELSIIELRDLRENITLGRFQRDVLPPEAWTWETEQMWTPPLDR